MTDNAAPVPTRQQIMLGSYAPRFRYVFVSRMLTILGLAAAVGMAFSWLVALVYLVVHAAALGLYIWMVEHAVRDSREPAPITWLARRSAPMSLLVSVPSVALALYVDHASPDLHVECVVLTMTLVFLMGVQVHLTNAGFLASVAPPILGLLAIAHTGPAETPYPHLAAGVLFTAAALASSWRQKQSDHLSAVRAADLADRNAALEAALVLAREQTSRAEAASRAKTELLAVTSHEVRTPLNAVLAMAAALEREAPSPRHAKLASDIGVAGAMLLRLLNGVLDFVSMEMGKAKLAPVPTHVGEMVEGIGAVWRTQCEAKGIGLAVEVAGDPDALGVSIDAPKVEQVLINLLSNAVKLTPTGGDLLIRARASSARGDRSRLRFEVADRGPGVPPDDRARIFEAFEQTAKGREAGGAGLGLTICRGSVSLMDGNLGFEDRPGGGSVFWFEIDAPKASRLTEMARAEPAMALISARILAADDNSTNREVLKLVLGPMGVDLVLVENGAEAVAAAALGGFDAILMDAKMPVMDGEAAVREIRAAEARQGRRTPIVMLTANVFPEDVARYLACGAGQVLAKPIDVKALYACLSDLAEQADEQQSAVA